MKKPAVRALIVEDSHAWQDILNEILDDAGLAVDVADSLDMAAPLVHAQPHRIAVVDLSLDGRDPHNQDGLRVLDIIRRHDPGCVAVLLTGFATVELAVSAIKEYGAYTCLQKEVFQRREFRDIINKALASVPPSLPVHKESAEVTPHAGRFTEVLPRPAVVVKHALVVEDDAGWRGILFEMLNDAGFQVRLCASFGEAMGSLRREHYHLAILDLDLSGAGSWAEAAAEGEPQGYPLLDAVREEGLPAIVVSGVAAPVDIERVYREKGVFAFIEKQSFDRQTFLRTVREAQSASQSKDELDQLTLREHEILNLLAQGKTNQEIADTLVISVNTVKRHLKAIFRKLDIHTRSAAVARATAMKAPVELSDLQGE